MVTLDQIRAFVAVAEELHFGRAAERLSMTQPPLSRQIQKLERAVGAHLLDRDNRRVRLTEAGAAYLAESYRMLALVDASAVRAQRVGRGEAGTLRLGFTAVSAIGILGPSLREIGRTLPGVHVELHEAVSPAQVESIRRGEIDIGLARPPFDTDLLASRNIQREPLVAVLPTGHRLAAIQRPLAPTDFDGEVVLGYHPQQARYFHDLATRFLVNAHPRSAQQVQQVLTALLLVAAGQGLAFAPASARLLGIDGVVLKPLAHGGAADRVDAEVGRPVELHAIWRRGHMTPMMKRAVAAIERVGASDEQE